MALKLKKVTCVGERECRPYQLRVGEEYWVEECSIYEDNGETFAKVYEDKYGCVLVGILSLKLFHLESGEKIKLMEGVNQ